MSATNKHEQKSKSSAFARRVFVFLKPSDKTLGFVSLVRHFAFLFVAKKSPGVM